MADMHIISQLCDSVTEITLPLKDQTDNSLQGLDHRYYTCVSVASMLRHSSYVYYYNSSAREIFSFLKIFCV